MDSRPDSRPHSDEREKPRLVLHTFGRERKKKIGAPAAGTPAGREGFAEKNAASRAQQREFRAKAMPASGSRARALYIALALLALLLVLLGPRPFLRLLFGP